MSGRRNRLRIVGGSHRGRILHFPDVRGLRPTADRVRETLFNWLQGEVGGRRVLDLFAGSGALGLEALSRGAAEAIFVERARPALQALRENLRLLGLDDRARVVAGDARRFLAGPPEPFDLVFLDPPFADDLLGDIARQLTEGGWLADDAWIYIEQDSTRDWPALPESWQPHRETRAGQAACRLVRFDPA